MRAVLPFIASLSFNRTNVELKLKQTVEQVAAVSVNRTNVELKRDGHRPRDHPSHGFNRTNVE